MATVSAGLIRAVEARKLKSVCFEESKKTTPTTAAVSSTATGTLSPVSSPCVSNGNQSSHENKGVCGDNREVLKKLRKHGRGLLILTVLLGVVLVGLVLLLLWKATVAWSRSRPRKHQSYKSVSHYFPFSHKKDLSGDVAMPELGMPKGMGAERKVLLDYSDEDDEF